MKNKTVIGTFLLFKDNKVFIENDNGEIINFTLNELNLDQQKYVTEKLSLINKINQIQNEKLNFNNLNKNIKIQTTDPLKIDSAFLPFKHKVRTSWDENYFYVESNGLPEHLMMKGITGWQQQVPIPQCYLGNNAWSIPLKPELSLNPIPVNQNHFLRGAIAIAVNGIPIFNPFTNTGVDALLDGQLDNWGGHCGRADDYHYHIAPMVLYEKANKNMPIAFALDGFAVYGDFEPNGELMKELDENHGHFDDYDVYHYHASKSAPYMIGKMVGKITEDSTLQIIPQAKARPIRTSGTPLKGAEIISCQANLNNNGYRLDYTLNNESYSIDYFWDTNGAYQFKYISPNSTKIENYKATVICETITHIQNEDNKESKLIIIPSPAKDIIYFSLKDQIDKISNVFIYDINGILINKFDNLNQSIDISQLNEGIYFLKFILNNKELSEKFIIKR